MYYAEIFSITSEHARRGLEQSGISSNYLLDVPFASSFGHSDVTNVLDRLVLAVGLAGKVPARVVAVGLIERRWEGGLRQPSRARCSRSTWFDCSRP
jgi:hypothetical protein